jgi:hypothetical protein
LAVQAHLVGVYLRSHVCSVCGGGNSKTDYVSQADRSRLVLNDPVIAFCSPVVREPFAPIKLKRTEVLQSGHAVEHSRVVTQGVTTGEQNDLVRDQYTIRRSPNVYKHETDTYLY